MLTNKVDICQRLPKNNFFCKTFGGLVLGYVVADFRMQGFVLQRFSKKDQICNICLVLQRPQKIQKESKINFLSKHADEKLTNF